MIVSDQMPTLNEIDHKRGPESAPLLLIAYGSYQCPQSGSAHKSVQNLHDALGEKLCFVFRHFPQLEQYPQARKAAETAEAAGSQGKFWEMHDQLFANPEQLDDASLVEYADQLGLDVEQFLRELAQHLHRDRINGDIASGKAYGVSATPTFFISIRHQGNNIESLVQQLCKAMDIDGSHSTLITPKVANN